jgi:hypothetical protein
VKNAARRTDPIRDSFVRGFLWHEFHARDLVLAFAISTKALDWNDG